MNSYSDEREILVYQMGKVASSTINRTLRSNGYQTRHFHYFDGDFASDGKSMREITGLNDLRGSDCLIVTLTRDPIARNLSAFFQNLSSFVKGGNGFEDEQALADTFLKKYNHKVPLEWFEKEFREKTGVDVYAHQFDKEAGYKVISDGRMKVLIIKSEVSDSSKLLALRRFLGPDGSPNAMLKSNIAKSKDYATLYYSVIKKIRLPPDYLNMMYDSRYSQHFYTSAEIESFRGKWSR